MKYGLLIIGLNCLIGTAFNLARRPIWVAILLHAAFNASSPVLAAVLADASIRADAQPDIVIVACVAGAGIVAALVTRGRFGAAPGSRQGEVGTDAA